jgi:hypothetical protein
MPHNYYVKRKIIMRETVAERAKRLNSTAQGRALFNLLHNYTRAELAEKLGVKKGLVARWVLVGHVSKEGARLIQEKIGTPKEVMRPDLKMMGWKVEESVHDGDEQVLLADLAIHYGSVKAFCEQAGIRIGLFHNWRSRGRIASRSLPRLTAPDPYARPDTQAAGAPHDVRHLMALLPNHLIEKANEDIVAVVSKYVALKKAGKSWTAKCPFHNERSASFTVSAGFYYCFGCGASGNAVGFVMDHLGVGFRQAVESILGRIDLEAEDVKPVRAQPRAIQCDLPGHVEDREKAATMAARCESAPQHSYFMRHGTAPRGDCMQLKGSLIIPLINNIGEQVNLAAITGEKITFAAGGPSYGSTAIIEPAAGHDGRTVICSDYAQAWRIWWRLKGRSRLLCTMGADNLNWMLAHCRDRFTHVACHFNDREEMEEMGHAVLLLGDGHFADLTESKVEAI